MTVFTVIIIEKKDNTQVFQNIKQINSTEKNLNKQNTTAMLNGVCQR